MATANVAAGLDLDGRKVLRLAAEPDDEAGRLARLGAILGRDFAANALSLDRPGATACACSASPACRPTTRATPPSSICS